MQPAAGPESGKRRYRDPLPWHPALPETDSRHPAGCGAARGNRNRMRVLVLHTIPPEATGPGRLPDEFDLSEAATNVASVLPEATVCRIRGEAREMLGLLDLHRPEVVFNLCEAPLGRAE